MGNIVIYDMRRAGARTQRTDRGRWAIEYPCRGTAVCQTDHGPQMCRLDSTGIVYTRTLFGAFWQAWKISARIAREMESA